MKLNIGSGKKPYTGYKTIDIEPKNNPDTVGDFRTMNFRNIDEIRAEHLLEHFSRDEAIQVLKQWHSWLRDGGILIVETPDFEEICKNFHKDEYWMTRHAYGSQEAEWAFHRDGWYASKFLKVLPEIGFDVIDMKRRITRGILPNIKVVARKHGL